MEFLGLLEGTLKAKGRLGNFFQEILRTIILHQGWLLGRGQFPHMSLMAVLAASKPWRGHGKFPKDVSKTVHLPRLLRAALAVPILHKASLETPARIFGQHEL